MSMIGRSGKRPSVLLIEEETVLVDEIREEFRSLGYPVRVASTLSEGISAARHGDAEIIIADRILQGGDSLSMFETLREEGVETPVLFISTVSSTDERIRSLRSGGDYLIKPFAMAELSARVDALLGRVGDAPITKLRASGIVMDLVTQTVRRGETVINLRPREFKLLEYFLRRPGKIITPAKLIDEVWRRRVKSNTNVIHVYVSQLRRKIDVAGERSLITNIRGAGFMLDVGSRTHMRPKL
jgi:two-component system OmpR family response regulator